MVVSHNSRLECNKERRRKTASGTKGVPGGPSTHATENDSTPSCVGFRVQGSGCRVQGAGCRVQGAGIRVQGAGCRVQGSGCRVQRVTESDALMPAWQVTSWALSRADTLPGAAAVGRLPHHLMTCCLFTHTQVRGSESASSIQHCLCPQSQKSREERIKSRVEPL